MDARLLHTQQFNVIPVPAPKPTQPAPERVEIRKYPNRRYYDSTHSRHLTLEEIRTLVREGKDIRVVDSQTRADITAQVLTQIILDLETDKLAMFPADFLARLIRLNDVMVRDYLSKYLSQSIMSFMEMQQKVGQHYLQHGLPSLPTMVPGWPQGFWNPFQPPGPGASPSTPSSAAPATEEEWRQRLQELEAQFKAIQEKLGGRPKSPAAKTRRARRRKS